MSIKKKLRSTLGELKVDNEPTKEYQQKVEFAKKGIAWRRRTVAERMYALEKLSQAQFDATERWLTTYVVTYDGPGAIQSRPSTSIIKHDQISWLLHMAQQKQSIPEVKAALGTYMHNLLVFSLYHGYCSKQLSEILLPGVDFNSSKKVIFAECRSAYIALEKFYSQRKSN